MTLFEVIERIEAFAKRQPSVNTIVRSDIFRINSQPSVKYGVFAWLQREHTGNVTTGDVGYNFTLFYIDRLLSDRSNEVEVQSVGCQVLGNILKLLNEGGVECDSYTIQPFTQRFTDLCAGVFCNVTLSTMDNTLCGEDYEVNGDITII